MTEGIPEPTPRTAAGRALLSHVKGLGPRLDTVTMTARRLRDGVLAIEAEAYLKEARALLDRWELFSHPIFGITRKSPRFDTQQFLAAHPEKP